MFRSGTRRWAPGTRLVSCSFFVTLVWTVTARAQTPAIPKMEFDEAIQRALDRNPTIAQAATAVTHADLLVQQARSYTLPTVSAQYGNSTLDGARGFTGGVFQPQNQSVLTGDVTVPVLNLSRFAAVPQARDQVEVARLSTVDVRKSVAVATAEAYLAVIAARRQLEVDQHALENARAHLEYAERRVEGGVGSRLNQIRAAQQASSGETLVENSRLGVLRAQEALGVLVAADGPVDAGLDPMFDIPSTIDEREWMQARTDMRVQQATQLAAERVVHDSWRDYAGTLSVSFDPQLVTPAGLFQPSRTWRLFVSFSQPIFEGGLRRSTSRLRELEVERTKIDRTDLELKARSEVRLAQESVQSYERIVTSARLAASQANDVLRITTSAFEVGATTNLEVVDAQRSTRDIESAAARAEDALRRTKLDLLVALGRFPK
jgi:outer membrane protein TolC